MEWKPLAEGNMVRWVSEKYFDKNELLDTKGTF